MITGSILPQGEVKDEPLAKVRAFFLKRTLPFGFCAITFCAGQEVAAVLAGPQVLSAIRAAEFPSEWYKVLNSFAAIPTHAAIIADNLKDV
ncbi:hypothetical protein ACYULU_16565 [Breznakiellaceae bacterium SP9]